MYDNEQAHEYERSSRFLDPTEYNRRMQMESLQKKEQEIVTSIKSLETKLIGTRQMSLSITDTMDLLEETIKTCGGESKVTFLEVNSDFISIQTRVPLTANLLQFKGESDDNPRFHKVVTKLLLQMCNVKGVRWLSKEDRESVMVVSLNKDY